MWNGIGGTSVANLTDSPDFYQTPDSTALVGSAFTSFGDNYGARTRGYITPAVSGLYTFWVSGDDETQLFFSSSASKWAASRIAGYSSRTPRQNWEVSYKQRSASRYLEAGQAYYVEMLLKEGVGDDHAAVACSVQGADPSKVINWATTAKGAVATASSNYGGAYPAANAMDGNTASFFHTNNDVNAWWMTDFRQDRPISSVELVNRQNACQNRLANFRVTVEDVNGVVVAARNFYEKSGHVGSSETWTLPKTVAGRRVKIQLLGPNRDNNYYLHLAEAKVNGPDVIVKNWARESTAVATASTYYNNAYPVSNVIDGNVNTFNHTNNTVGSWVQVNLGADRTIDVLELINRQDAAQNRLSNFRVSVLNAQDSVVASQDYYRTSGNVQGAFRWELPQGVTGRKVRVELLGSNREGTYYLHLGEINVWGRTDSAASGRGLRGLVSADVMSSYVPSLTDDPDDDGIPSNVELANGLNPNDSSDATADFDNDGISNFNEIHASSNPNIWDSVPGILVDEIWHNISGDNLTVAGYKAAFTRDPDEIHNITTTQAFDHGEQYVRRVRGYITAPVTGAYQFWGAADSDVDMFLSTTASKFYRQLILDDKVFTPITSYDVDTSQKSRLITLTAGQKYYFEMWHKEGIGGSYYSVAWKKPGGSRELIPSQYLSSYAGEANDQDDDYLKDDYELANGLSITDNGRSPGSKDGAYGDLDGDGLTNEEEMKAGTKAGLADSDGDGVSDYDEANFFNSATLANDIGPFASVATLNGDDYTGSFGEWEKAVGKAMQACRRGYVEYPVTVQTSGVYALKFQLTSQNDGAQSEQYDFMFALNGKNFSFKTITIEENGSASLGVLTPWLNAGETYTIRLFVDNSYNFRRISVDQVEILAASGTDSNDNQIPDWVDIRVHTDNGFDYHVLNSKTSPAVLEGNARYPQFVSTGGAALKQAPNGRFYHEQPLIPGSPSTLNYTFENGGLNDSVTVNWLPTNLLLENNLTIRQGDSLLLTAFNNAEQASLETYSIITNGQTVTNTADQPSPQVFTTPGTATIQLTHTSAGAIVTNRTITVNVLPLVNIPAPLCVTGYQRLWTYPALPPGATMQIDDRVVRLQEAVANTCSLLTTTPENQRILIRQGPNGLILGSSEVQSVCVRTNDFTGNIVEAYNATTTTLKLPVVANGHFGDAEIRCKIIIGGVTFADGTTTFTLRAPDFDPFGSASLFFIKSNSAHSNCRQFSIWSAGVCLATFN